MKSAVICLAVLPVVVVVAQERKPEPFDLRAHYTKYEYRIPTRDGVHLFTSIYVPKDTSHPYPFLMTRTPYSVAPYGEDHYRSRLGQSEAFERAGYIFVFQDVRGRYQSGDGLSICPRNLIVPVRLETLMRAQIPTTPSNGC